MVFLFRNFFLILTIFFFVNPTSAVNPDEVLENPILEQKAREISKGLRCLVCQNQSIDDSDAKLAKDLRLLVRERLLAGDTSEKVKNYIVSRYGDFVLLNPPFKLETFILWTGPFILLLIGLITVYLFFNSQNREVRLDKAANSPLNPEEEKKIKKIMKELNND